MNYKSPTQFEAGLERLLEETKQRCEVDAVRYKNQDWDLCVVCFAYGADKRSLFIDCFYAIGEVVPEAMDIQLCNVEDHKRGWYLRICKSCRGRLLAMLSNWAAGGRARRGISKDHDGNADPDPTGSRNIPVRIHGAVVMMNMEEYSEYKKKHEAAQKAITA